MLLTLILPGFMPDVWYLIAWYKSPGLSSRLSPTPVCTYANIKSDEVCQTLSSIGPGDLSNPKANIDVSFGDYNKITDYLTHQKYLQQSPGYN